LKELIPQYEKQGHSPPKDNFRPFIDNERIEAAAQAALR